MKTPELIQSPQTLYKVVQEFRAQGKRVGLVPTMGALHDGHLSLVRCSQEECDATIVTIFVNPTQFAPGEDFEKYPRTLDADMEKLAGCDVRWVFSPAPELIYPDGFSTYIDVEGITEPLEGEFRPGHFRGVATIVLKLLNMAGADVAYFGQKDFQQAAMIRRMVEDLNHPTEIRVCPIVREPDGLAMSSRNVYLSPDQRQQALALHKALDNGRLAIEQLRTTDAALIEAGMRNIIIEIAPDAEIEYAVVVDPDTLRSVGQVRQTVLLALAVRVGATRLIDNCLVMPPVAE